VRTRRGSRFAARERNSDIVSLKVSRDRPTNRFRIVLLRVRAVHPVGVQKLRDPRRPRGRVGQGLGRGRLSVRQRGTIRLVPNGTPDAVVVHPHERSVERLGEISTRVSNC